MLEIEAIPNLTSEQKQEFIAKNMPSVVESQLYNSIQKAPEQTKKNLEEGRYNGIKYFDAKMKRRYITAANTEIRRQKSLARIAQTNNYASLQEALFLCPKIRQIKSLRAKLLR